MDEQKAPNPEVQSPGYERQDLSIKPLLIFVAGLIVTAVVILLGVTGLMRRFDASAAAREKVGSPIAAESQIPPEPRLELDERKIFVQIRDKEEQLLNHYSWVNQTTDTVRIPISRAMELVAQRGLPARTPIPEKK